MIIHIPADGEGENLLAPEKDDDEIRFVLLHSFPIDIRTCCDLLSGTMTVVTCWPAVSRPHTHGEGIDGTRLSPIMTVRRR